MSSLKRVLLSAAWLGLNAHAQVLAQSGPGPQPQFTGGVSNSVASGTTGSNALPPKWGEGVLELDFLRKLRLFLETDPFDFKAFESTFKVPLEVRPKDGPHSGGSWGVHSVYYELPFGRSGLIRGAGGVHWSFLPSQNSSAVLMHFAGHPPVGRRDGDAIPCISPELADRAFAQSNWKSERTYSNEHGVPVPNANAFSTISVSGVAVKVYAGQRHQCVPSMTVTFESMPGHPALFSAGK